MLFRSFFEYCSSLTNVNLSGLTTLGNSTFYNCTGLTSVSCPTATFIDNGAFYGCSSLSTISLPNASSMGTHVFYQCTVLSNLNIPNCLTLGPTTGDNNIFGLISGSTVTVTLPTSLMSCNGGLPDGDIQTLQANNTVTITTV